MAHLPESAGLPELVWCMSIWWLFSKMAAIGLGYPICTAAMVGK